MYFAHEGETRAWLPWSLLFLVKNQQLLSCVRDLSLLGLSLHVSASMDCLGLT